MTRTNADVAKDVAKPLTQSQKNAVVGLMVILLIFMVVAVLALI